VQASNVLYCYASIHAYGPNGNLGNSTSPAQASGFFINHLLILILFCR